MQAFSGLQPFLQPYADALYSLAVAYKLQPRITSVYRSPAEQRVLYNRYQSGASSLPASAPGRSLHNYGHAFDLVVKDAAAQAWLGQVWQSWGGRWGGTFKDPVHFDSGARIS